MHALTIYIKSCSVKNKIILKFYNMKRDWNLPYETLPLWKNHFRKIKVINLKEGMIITATLNGSGDFTTFDYERSIVYKITKIENTSNHSVITMDYHCMTSAAHINEYLKYSLLGFIDDYKKSGKYRFCITNFRQKDETDDETITKLYPFMDEVYQLQNIDILKNQFLNE